MLVGKMPQRKKGNDSWEQVDRPWLGQEIKRKQQRKTVKPTKGKERVLLNHKNLTTQTSHGTSKPDRLQSLQTYQPKGSKRNISYPDGWDQRRS